MLETLIAVLGSLTALGSVAVSFMAYRQQVTRAAALEAREARIEARETRIEAREAALELQEQRLQASMIEVHISTSQSPLHDGWVTGQVTIVNPSNQPISDVEASYLGVEVPDTKDHSIGPGSTHRFQLPPYRPGGLMPDVPDGPPKLHEITLSFYDAAGTRWRRDGRGGLYKGRRVGDNWVWDDQRENPVIREASIRADEIAPSPHHLLRSYRGFPIGVVRELDALRALVVRYPLLAWAVLWVGMTVVIALTTLLVIAP
ncbi:hypothetical protein ACIF8T_39560 [Streptomyces sp. NPDC085946]|uniref:hypothetical protein n=1 Tax=Streptomyces sp. NPDC085946 TaxID=3365744 RepID=UPI0037D33F9A